MIDGVILKGRCVVIPESLQKQVLEQLYVNHMGIEKTKPRAHEWNLVDNYQQWYWKAYKNCPTCLDFQQKQPKEKIIHLEVPENPKEIVGADMFTLHNRNYLCILDYHSTFSVIKKIKDLSAESLILTCKIFFLEYSLPKKIMSGSVGNFIADKFKTLWRSLNIEQAFSLSYKYQNNGQVEACIKLIKQKLKKNGLILNLTHI